MEISLALGGGGIKGIAHIGVIRILEKSGYKIRAIAGTSIGGAIGALYASGLSVEEISSVASTILTLSQSKLYSRRPEDGPSLLGYSGLVEKLLDSLGDKTFDDLVIPFSCTAVDIRTSREVWIRKGRLIDAVSATIALPGVFPPYIFGKAELVDGGVADPVPVRLARDLAPGYPVVSVALLAEPDEWDRVSSSYKLPAATPIPQPILHSLTKWRVGQAMQIFLQSMDISSRIMSELRLDMDCPEIIIRPNVHRYGLLDVGNLAEFEYEGEKSAKASLSDIADLFSWTNRTQRFIKNKFSPRRKDPLLGENIELASR